MIPEAKVDNNVDFIESQQSHHVESEPHQVADKHQSTQPPQFSKELQPSITVNQGGAVRLDTMVDPRNDVTLSVDWLKDGQSVSMGKISFSVEKFGSFLKCGLLLRKPIQCCV